MGIKRCYAKKEMGETQRRRDFKETRKCNSRTDISTGEEKQN